MKYKTLVSSWCAAALVGALQSSGIQALAGPPTTNMVLWLTADTGVSTNPIVGPAQAYAWQDQAPGGLHGGTLVAGAATSLEQATFPNGQHPVINFNGTGGFTLSNSPSLQVPEISIYVVASVDNQLQSKELIGCYYETPEGGWGLGINDSIPGRVKWWTAVPKADTLSTTTMALGQDAMTEITATSSSGAGTKAVYFNGTQVGLDTGLAPMFYSSNEFGMVGYLDLAPGYAPRQMLVGDIAEILVYNSVDSGQQSAVESYLNAKYFTSGTVVPPSTNGLIVWLKADAGVVTNPPPPQVTVVAYGWNDQAPGSMRFGTARGQPTVVQDTFPNGQQHPAIHLDGSSGFAMDNAVGMESSSISLYVVASVATNFDSEALISCYNDATESVPMGGWLVGISDVTDGTVKWFSANPGPDDLEPSSPLGNNQPSLIEAMFDDANGTKTLYINGAQAGIEPGEAPISFSGYEVLSLGYLTPFRQQLHGDVAEVIACNSVDPSQRSSVDAYLNAKYFTTGTVVPPPTNGMLLWFSADAGVITQAPTPVAGWTNQASAGVHSATTPLSLTGAGPKLAQAPFPNGQHPVIRFGGTGGMDLDNQNLELENLTAYIVGRLDSSFTASQLWFGEGSDPGHGWSVGVNDSTAGWIKFWSMENAADVLSCPVPDSTPVVLAFTASTNTGVKAIYINSVSVTNDAALTDNPITYNPSTDSLMLGQYNPSPSSSGQHVYGDIAEVLLFSSVDTNQQTAVEKYLQQKYFHPNPPANLAPPTNNLVIWLKADAGVNTNFPPMIQVYNWADQSPGGLHYAMPIFAASGAAVTPTGNPVLSTAKFPNGQQHPVITFGGQQGFELNDYADLRLTDFSVYLVGSVVTNYASRIFIQVYENGNDGWPEGGWSLGINDSIPGRVKWWNDPNGDDISPAAAALGNNTPTLIAGTFSGDLGTKALYINSVQVGNETRLPPVSYSGHELGLIGCLTPEDQAQQELIGSIAEIIVYSTVDSAQLAAVQSYLTAKYFSTAPPPSPTLKAKLSGNQLTLTWTASGFVLQQNSSLVNKAGWTNVTGGGASPVTVTVSSTGQQFFRLISQ